MTERLDLEEGKRLLSELRKRWSRADTVSGSIARARMMGDDLTCTPAEADALLAAAEEAEKLRALLREARPVLEATLYAGSMDVAHLHALQDAARTLLDARIDAALTPPEPLSAQQETP